MVPWVGGGMGWVGSGGWVDHGELSGGAHREAQEQRAAPQLCLGRRPLLETRPARFLVELRPCALSDIFETF